MLVAGKIKELCDEREYQKALEVLEPYFEQSPHDDRVWFTFGYILLRSDKMGPAMRVFESLVSDHSDKPQVWNNLGKALTDLRLNEEAERCFAEAIRLDPNEYVHYMNRSTNAVQAAKPDDAIKWAYKMLEHDPESGQAHTNLGFAMLSKYQWFPGWEEYEHGLGHIKYRDERCYMGEPRWDGEHNKSIIVYGEQGLGEQIAFAQAIPEARKDSRRLVMDVHKKLAGLFTRSFLVPAYGNLGTTDPARFPWVVENPPDASISLASLMKLYRHKASQFTGKPYLKADMVRRRQWQATLSEIPKGLKVGIAWTGGSHPTFAKERSTDLETLYPLLATKGVQWVCLEYKDRTDQIQKFSEETGITIHDYSWATRTQDYDDTAALVAELDLVISIPTTVVHLAGALGTQCWCLVNPRPHFLMGVEGEASPWYGSVRYYRRDGLWDMHVLEVAKHLEEFIEASGNHAGRPWPREHLQASG